MRIVPLGETAWILADLEVAPWWVAERLREAPVDDLVDCAASYETVGLYFAAPPGPRHRKHIEDCLECLPQVPVEQPLIEVPVCYELGEDTDEVAARLGLDAERLGMEHSSIEYRCHAVGFQPGFPYLGYLPDSLTGIPRLASPRARVPSGAVGLTGRQTGIYPGGSPGGWPLIGRTPLLIADLDAGRFLFRAGCRVRFSPITRERFDALQAGDRTGTI